MPTRILHSFDADNSLLLRVSMIPPLTKTVSTQNDLAIYNYCKGALQSLILAGCRYSSSLCLIILN